MSSKSRNGAGSISRTPTGWVVKITIPATRDVPSRRVSRSAQTQAEARTVLRNLQRESRDLGSRAAEVLRPRGRILVRDYLAEFGRVLARDVARGKIRPRTAEDYLKICRLRIVPVLGHRAVADLEAEDGLRLAASMTGLAPATCRRAVATLVRVMRSAEAADLLRPGVAGAVELPSGQPVEDEGARLDLDETRLLLKIALEDARAGRAAAAPVAALLMLFTGMRRSEALGLRWMDVNLEAGTAAIRQSVTELAGGEIVLGSPKSKTSRRMVRLGATLVEILSALSGAYAPQDRICGVRPSNLSRYVREAGKRALGRGVGCHELRRGWTDLALASGQQPLDVSRGLGHSDMRLLYERYAGRRTAAVLGAGDAVAGLLEG